MASNPPQSCNEQETERGYECIQPSVDNAIDYGIQEKISVPQVGEYEYKDNEKEIVTPKEGEPISQCYHNANENVESFTHDETHVIQNGKEDEKTDEKFVAAGEDHVSYEHQDTSQENNHLINSPSTPLQDENWNNPLTLQDVIMRKFANCIFINIYMFKGFNCIFTECDLPVLGNGDEEQFNFDDVDLCKFIYYLLLECIYNFYLFFTGTPRPVIHPENTSRSKWKQRSFDADLDYEV